MERSVVCAGAISLLAVAVPRPARYAVTVTGMVMAMAASDRTREWMVHKGLFR
jgi:hypothetical protein